MVGTRPGGAWASQPDFGCGAGTSVGSARVGRLLSRIGTEVRQAVLPDPGPDPSGPTVSGSKARPTRPGSVATDRVRQDCLTYMVRIGRDRPCQAGLPDVHGRTPPVPFDLAGVQSGRLLDQTREPSILYPPYLVKIREGFSPGTSTTCDEKTPEIAVGAFKILKSYGILYIEGSHKSVGTWGRSNSACMQTIARPPPRSPRLLGSISISGPEPGPAAQPPPNRCFSAAIQSARSGGSGASMRRPTAEKGWMNPSAWAWSA